MDRAISIYNPQELDEKLFRARFSARKELLEDVLREVLATGPEEEFRHEIIMGQRGQGKTTLLRMLFLRLQDKKEEYRWLVPLLFKEEQYGVGRLCRLWERTAEMLTQTWPEFSTVLTKFEESFELPRYEEDCFSILHDELKRQDLHLLLLIDNIGDLFAKFKPKEMRRLREILTTTNRIRLVGASTVMLEQHFDHSAPFYQFFRMRTLKGLEREETESLLLNLGDKQQKKAITRLLKEAPGRIEALRRLTTGVPRTMILLFHILLDENGNVFHDLEQLLDLVTPLYKHRMDDLSGQQQEIVEAVALAWDAANVSELAKTARLPGKQVSAQLRQLVKNHIVEQIKTSTKNYLYRLEERFFNIWYLMRNGRPGDKRRVRWLAHFLEAWCDAEELKKKAECHIRAMTGGSLRAEHVWFMTEALKEAGLDWDTEDELTKVTREHLDEDLKSCLSPSMAEQFEQATDSYQQGDYQTAEQLIKPLAEKGNARSMYNLALLYESHLERYEEAEAYYLMAVEKGNVKAMNNLATLYMNQARKPDTALTLAKFSAKATNHPVAHLNYALILLWNNQILMAFSVIEKTLSGPLSKSLDGLVAPIAQTIELLLAAGQSVFVRRLFEDETYTDLCLRDRFKPLYFVLLQELGDKRKDDYRRAGPEFTKTIQEIRKKITWLRESCFTV